MRYLPPLTNLLAAYIPAPERLAAIEHRLLQADATRISRPGPGWIVAETDLPRTQPPDPSLADSGWFFSEGRQGYEDASARNELDLRVARSRAGEHGAIAEMAGDFGFVRIDQDRRLTAVRSCGGLVPFYLWEHEDGIVLSTTATPLATVAGHRLEPDPVVTAIWLYGWPCFPLNRSQLAGVRILGKGEVFHWRPGQSGRIDRYWFPPARADVRWPTRAIRDEHARALRTALVDGLRTNLDPDGDNLLSHSGGVDSTSLLALASRHLGLRVRTVSLVPPADAANLTREMDYLHDQQRTYGVSEATEVVFGSQDEEDRYERLPPIAMPALNPTLMGLTGRSQPTVHFGGEFADEVVGSRTFTIRDLVTMTPRWRWPLLLLRMPRTRLLARTLLASLAGRSRAVPSSLPATLPTWFAPDVRDAFEEVNEAQRRHWRQIKVTRVANPTLFARAVDFDFQAMQWEACSAMNVRRYHPFATREVLEIALRSHPLELVGRTDKLLLRRALAGLVEPRHLLRDDGGSFGMPPRDSRGPTSLRTPGLAAIISPGQIVMNPRHRLLVMRCDRSYAALQPMLPREVDP